jgi:hypothetical protein
LPTPAPEGQTRADATMREMRPRLRGPPPYFGGLKGAWQAEGRAGPRSSRNVQGPWPGRPGWRKAGRTQIKLGLAQDVRGPIGLSVMTPGGKQARGPGTGKAVHLPLGCNCLPDEGLRGARVGMGGRVTHYLFTTRYVRAWQEYHGPHIPSPLEIGAENETDTIARAKEPCSAHAGSLASDFCHYTATRKSFGMPPQYSEDGVLQVPPSVILHARCGLMQFEHELLVTVTLRPERRLQDRCHWVRVGEELVETRDAPAEPQGRRGNRSIR